MSTAPIIPPFLPSLKNEDHVTFSRQDAHAEKVRSLASALVRRYGKGAVSFVAQQVVESDDANRTTWLAVMDALPR